jgi:hypothetical protein
MRTSQFVSANEHLPGHPPRLSLLRGAGYAAGTTNGPRMLTPSNTRAEHPHARLLPLQPLGCSYDTVLSYRFRLQPRQRTNRSPRVGQDTARKVASLCPSRYRSCGRQPRQSDCGSTAPPLPCFIQTAYSTCDKKREASSGSSTAMGVDHHDRADKRVATLGHTRTAEVSRHVALPDLEEH